MLDTCSRIGGQLGSRISFICAEVPAEAALGKDFVPVSSASTQCHSTDIFSLRRQCPTQQPGRFWTNRPLCFCSEAIHSDTSALPPPLAPFGDGLPVLRYGGTE